MPFFKQTLISMTLLLITMQAQSQSPLSWLTKINTSVLTWATHLNAEAEMGVGQDVSLALAAGISINDGQYLQAAGRYYFNTNDQESALMKSTLTVPLLNGKATSLNVLAGYQLVFNRQYSMDVLLGMEISDFQVSPKVEVNVGFLL